MTMNEFLAMIEAKNPGQPEFLQAVTEVVESIWEVYSTNPRYVSEKVLERIAQRWSAESLLYRRRSS